MSTIVRVYTLICMSLFNVGGQQFLDIQYRLYNLDTGWTDVINYECNNETPLHVNDKDGVTIYLDPPQQQTDHAPCICRATVLSDPYLHRNTDLRVWKDPSAQITTYATDTWTDPETGKLVLAMERGQSETWLVLDLSTGRRNNSAPITFRVSGDFELICQAQESVALMPAPSVSTQPWGQSTRSVNSAEDKDESFLMMQVTLAALLSTGAVVMVTLAVGILCCYKRHKKRKSNSIVTEKVLPQQPFMDIKHEQYRRQYSNVKNNNPETSTGTEHLYDNNIPTQNTNAKRKTLSFRDTMYTNFTAIVAAFGQARENSRKAKQRESSHNTDRLSKLSNEPPYDNAKTRQINQNQITDGIEYAQIDISRLVEMEPKAQAEDRSEQDVKLQYADLAF